MSVLLAPAPAAPAATAAASAGRLQGIDLLRGLVIAIMALDHVRDFFHADSFRFDPLDLDHASPALFLTRWITHLCAPTFVFLAGVSAFLHGQRCGGRAPLARFLFTRGLWLVALEVTVIGFGWSFVAGRPFLQVFWALGGSMMVLAALAWLPPPALLAIGTGIVAGHNLLDPVEASALGAGAPWWVALHDGGVLRVGDAGVFVLYPLLPWIGVMLAGYGCGPLFRAAAPVRRRLLTAAGLAMLAGFFLLRGLHGYGDPGDWQVHGEAWRTAGDFLDVRKYPPSLLFVLVTLGIALVLLPRLEHWRGSLAGILLAFGRVPLFAYVLHLYLVHGLMMAVGMAMGHPAALFIGTIGNPRALAEAGWGFSLAATWGVWLLVLAAMVPACRWYAGVKARRRDWWLSYL